jgi:hypothetical protein
VPPVLIAGGIAAAGSIASSVISSSSSSKAAKAQQAVADKQIANNNANRDYVTGLEQPTINRGNAAGDLYGRLSGYWRRRCGRQVARYLSGLGRLSGLAQDGSRAVNSNAYARGMGDSGATLKALQQKGMALADQNQSVYMGHLNNLIQTGNSAIGNVAGVATQTTGANNAALGNAADAQSNSALAQGAAWSQAIKNLANIGSGAVSGGFASSYHPTGGTPISAGGGGFGAFNPMNPVGYYPSLGG